MPSSAKVGPDGRLTISEIKAEASGLYQCLAQNSINRFTGQSLVFVQSK